MFVIPSFFSFVRFRFQNASVQVRQCPHTFLTPNVIIEMTDINDLLLIGRAKYVKFGRASTGTVYASFILETSPHANVKENSIYSQHQFLFTTCFRKRQIDYLKNVDLKDGNTVVVLGYLSSYPSEIKGEKITSIGVCAREVYVVKTVKDIIKEKEEENGTRNELQG